MTVIVCAQHLAAVLKELQCVLSVNLQRSLLVCASSRLGCNHVEKGLLTVWCHYCN